MTTTRSISIFASSLALCAVALTANVAAAQTPAAATDDQAKATPSGGQKLECADLKQKIETKLEAKGVKGYQLDIIDADATTDGKIVGQCDGGKHKISYTRQSK